MNLKQLPWQVEPVKMTIDLDHRIVSMLQLLLPWLQEQEADPDEVLASELQLAVQEHSVNDDAAMCLC